MCKVRIDEKKKKIDSGQLDLGLMGEREWGVGYQELPNVLLPFCSARR